MAQMVWCNSCKTVVWAYDAQPSCGLSRIVNELALPCPLCREKGNFDGWGNDNPVELLNPHHRKDIPIFDGWSAMKEVAKEHKVKWNPSPDNHWFRN